MKLQFLAFSLLALALSCTGELTTGPGGGGGGGGGGVDGGSSAQARLHFEQNVQPLLHLARPKGSCAQCHQGVAPAGPAFMGAQATDNYDSLANGSLVSASPANSRLITYGNHDGDPFCTGAQTPYIECGGDEVSVISEWINLQNGN